MEEMNNMPAGCTDEKNECANSNSMPEECPHRRTKHRSDKEFKDLLNRLNRIEGQVRGIKGMVENDAYCIDIINQVSAVTSALNSFNRVLLSEHMLTCVTEDIREGKEEKMDELVRTVQKLMR